MAYHINAELQHGSPRLEILDANTSSVRLAWAPLDGNESTDKAACEIRHFFRELMLITTIDELMSNT